jgi:membrane protein YdbS with pleckstrin-like domain
MPDVQEFSRLELWVQRVLRVPPYPQPPEGSPESIQVFRAGRNHYTLCLLAWFFPHFAVLVALIVAHVVVTISAADRMPEWGWMIWRIAEGLAVLAFTSSTIFTYYAQRLNFALHWYIVTDRSLRIRSGVVNIQELTMTYSNIQEIRVSAGPLQNFLKLADVEVQSAGGGSKDGGGHIARFKSVSNANAIRDLLVERVRQYRDSGLGEAAAHGGHAPDDAIEAARSVLTEARALREQLQAPAN